METQTHIQKELPRVTAVFVGLMIAAGSLVVAASLVGPGFAQLALLAIGAALMGSGLTFFLVSLFWWVNREPFVR